MKDVLQELAVKVYELRIEGEVPRFQEVGYEIEADNAESITIDHLNKNVEKQGTSNFADGISSSLSSVKNLKEKLEFILNSLN